MRSLLFVPADDDAKIDEALNCGADAVILDLEDSVAAENKPRAREAVRALLRGAGDDEGPELLVRVNALDEAEFNADMVALSAHPPAAFMLPKAEGAACLDRMARAAGPVPVVAIAAETPMGVLRLPSFAEQRADNLMALTWGAEDLSAQLGAATNRDEYGHHTAPYRLARAMCLMTARAANVEPIDTVFVNYRDEETLAQECAEAFRDGFAGKLAIHPSQVSVINSAFTPTSEQIAKAGAIVNAFAQDPNAGVVSIDGRMYDRPHLIRSRRLLRKARRYGLLQDNSRQGMNAS
ncbi:MAG TPA: CoA ester lyase [Thermopetrobacter sp.]|nr:CoA ester lyase [Thermopetrobacter sp.]